MKPKTVLSIQLHIFIGLVLGLHGCSIRKASPLEAPLFVRDGAHQVWVVDAVLEEQGGKDHHLCALITYEQTTGVQHLGCFFHRWNPEDSSHATTVRLGEGEIRRSGRWPIALRIPADSVQPAFAWDWSHRSFWLQGIPSSGLGLQADATWSWKGKYTNIRSFDTATLSEKPAVKTVAPWVGYSRITGVKGRFDTRWRMGVFTEAEALFGADAGEAFVWLSFGLSDGRDMQAYLHVSAKGKAQLLGLQTWEAGVMTAPVPVHASFQLPPNANWHSVRSGKDYPLTWRLNADQLCCAGDGDDADFLLRPRQYDQEVQMKRNSFWMGAIEAVEISSSKIVGKGNMLVLVR
jgi:hypothetical protein